MNGKVGHQRSEQNRKSRSGGFGGSLTGLPQLGGVATTFLALGTSHITRATAMCWSSLPHVAFVMQSDSLPLAQALSVVRQMVRRQNSEQGAGRTSLPHSRSYFQKLGCDFLPRARHSFEWRALVRPTLGETSHRFTISASPKWVSAQRCTNSARILQTVRGWTRPATGGDGGHLQ